jgi:hypothetical protein
MDGVLLNLKMRNTPKCKQECGSTTTTTSSSSFLLKIGLTIHMETIDLKPEKEDRCKECGKCFGMKGNVCIHTNGWVVDLEMTTTTTTTTTTWMQTGMWIILWITVNQSH